MKKLLIVCLLAYFTPSFGQKSSINIDSLIESQHFTFIVTEIQKKPGFNGVSNVPVNPVYTYQYNPSVTTPSQKANIVNMSLGSNGIHRQQEFYRLSVLDGSYRNTYQQNDKTQKKVINGQRYEVYFIQEKDKIEISEQQNPSSLDVVMNDVLISYAKPGVNITSKKKKNGNWLITYGLKNQDETRKFYMDIEKDGKATLTQSAQKTSTTILYGYILPSN
ncbi:MAG: hypothetical protein EOP00_11800 [Pedobacter sp.]|nr:MAG: hypothetical protein EOP00_11800 [Pedobacter sp.]